MLRICDLLELLFQPVPLRHHALAIARHHRLQTDGLPHQIGDHGEEARLVIQRNHRRVARVWTLDGEGADHPVVVLDGNTDESAMPFGALTIRQPVREQRVGRDVAHHKGHPAHDNLADRPFGQMFEILLRRAFAPPGAYNHLGLALGSEQGNKSILHIEKAGKQGNYIGKSDFDARRTGQDLGDFVDTDQPGFGPSRAPRGICDWSRVVFRRHDPGPLS